MNHPRRRRMAAVLRRSIDLFSHSGRYRDLGSLLLKLWAGGSPAAAAGGTNQAPAGPAGGPFLAMAAKPERARRTGTSLPQGRRQLHPSRERPIPRRPTEQTVPCITTAPCWVITLDPEGERARSLVASLKEQRLPARAIPGVDGRGGMPRLEPGERLENATTRRRHLCEMKSSEVGCYLAHLRAIRRAYDSGLERVCILEDDVRPEADFGSVLAELEQLPDEVEMVRLMGLKMRKRKEVQPLAGGSHQLVRPERGWCGAQGYLINRAGMQKVLKHGGRIFEPIDKLFDHFWQFDLYLYGVEPHLLWETEHESSVEKSNVGRDRVAPWLYWLHPLGKLWRSLERHYYLRRHGREFYPARKPERRTGRTARIKP